MVFFFSPGVGYGVLFNSILCEQNMGLHDSWHVLERNLGGSVVVGFRSHSIRTLMHLCGFSLWVFLCMFC